MLVMTSYGVRLCSPPTADVGALPAWLTGIGKAILGFFKTLGPSLTQVVLASGARVPVDPILIRANGEGGGGSSGGSGSGGQRRTITLTPEMARQWLTLFCQFGLLPRENCVNVLPAPGTPPPPGPPPSQGNWWEKIPTPVWIALTALGVALLVRQLR
jgi:hypothetical protein